MPPQGDCDVADDELIFAIQSMFGLSNESAKFSLNALSNGENGCHGKKGNISVVARAHDQYFSDLLESYTDIDGLTSQNFGKDFYAYITPLIIIVGIVGNIASLCVFISRRLRALSASHYLAALSASDTIVLVVNVFLEWLNKGLPRWPGNHLAPLININGVCHVFLLVSYTFRFVSVYLILVFTIERYIAVCKPLKRRMICTRNVAKKLILMVVFIGATLSVPKPIMSGIYNTNKFKPEVIHSEPPNELHPAVDFLDFNERSENFSDAPTTQISSQTDPIAIHRMCKCNSKYDSINFVFEIIYVVLITAVPFVLMAFFNVLIMRRLIRRFSATNKLEVSFRENRIRWEFTVMLLVVSSCFIFLNVPYFVIWVQLVEHAKRKPGDIMRLHVLRSRLHFTKVIFYLNYCINFFLYCLTGSYYRNVIKEWFSCFRWKGQGREGQARFSFYSPSARKFSHSMSMATQTTFV